MNNYAPMFSIIIPVYNTVSELRRCVNSVLAQCFDNYEVILVDDGSTDGSGQLCDQLSEEESRIIAIHKQNGGAADARNAGVRAATGEYLLFLDSDDLWDDNNALLEINHIIEQNVSVDLICFGVTIIDAEGKIEKIRKPELPSNNTCDKESIARHLVYTNQYFSASYVKVLRREYFIYNNLYFISGLLSEDIEWSARVLISCKSLAIYPKAFYKRIRRKEASLTASIDDKNIDAILDSIEEGVTYINNHVEDNLSEVYYEYWAYQYAMLFTLVRLMEKGVHYHNVLSRMKKFKWLLKYDHVAKVRIVHICVKIVGIKAAAKICEAYANGGELTN